MYYTRAYMEVNSFTGKKISATMHNLIAILAQLTRSEAGDEDDEVAVVENGQFKMEGMVENDMIRREVFAGDLAHDEHS